MWTQQEGNNFLNVLGINLWNMVIMEIRTVAMFINIPWYSKVPWVNMEPTMGWQDPGGPHVGPMNLAIQVIFLEILLQLLWLRNMLKWSPYLLILLT